MHSPLKLYNVYSWLRLEDELLHDLIEKRGLDAESLTTEDMKDLGLLLSRSKNQIQTRVKFLLEKGFFG